MRRFFEMLNTPIAVLAVVVVVVVVDGILFFGYYSPRTTSPTPPSSPPHQKTERTTMGPSSTTTTFEGTRPKTTPEGTVTSTATSSPGRTNAALIVAPGEPCTLLASFRGLVPAGAYPGQERTSEVRG